MEPVQYLSALRRRWWVVALALVAGAVAVVVTTPARPPAVASDPSQAYQATHTFLYERGGGPAVPSLEYIVLFTQYGEVPRRVAAAIGSGEDPSVLAGRISVTADEVGVLKIATTDPDRDKAVLVVSTFAAELVAYLNDTAIAERQQAIGASQGLVDAKNAEVLEYDRRLAAGSQPELTRAQRDAAVQGLRNAESRLQQLRDAAAAKAPLTTLAGAVATQVSIGGGGFDAPTTRSGRLPLVAGMALLLGIGAALAVDRLDSRLYTRAAAETAFGLPVVAEVPRLPRHRRRRAEVVAVVEPGSVVAEAYRMVRTAVLVMGRASNLNGASNGATHTRSGGPSRPQVIVVTSPGPAEAKTTSVANLAACLGETGLSVLVLAGDLYSSRLEHVLGAGGGSGLRGVLRERGGSVRLQDATRPTAIPNVRVVPSGARDGAVEALTFDPAVIDEARTLADIVLVDTSPLLTMSDASELVPSADALLVVARAGQTRAEAAARAAELLERLGARTLGVVLVGSDRAGAVKYAGGYGARGNRLLDMLASLVPHGQRLPSAGAPGPGAEGVPAISAPLPVSWVAEAEPARPAPVDPRVAPRRLRREALPPPEEPGHGAASLNRPGGGGG
ncbi:MAG: hypothetical protein ACRD0M_00590, partial [Acidimicrobiales bacterium]